ncbi:terpene synthase family protein [Crossiella cryophila]|uniref:Terpene synthase n=1 Tax=Crossiella cryophila TaxID=43355 RepID=A0A7W7CI03_9PSEU|nr:terpene synthase family protein [Crossiella cryophila]MBB4680103.1 hypothetical protein [Crossiella cryophila]
MTPRHSFTIPKLIAPYPVLIHPGRAAAHRLLVEWKARYGLTAEPGQEEAVYDFSGLVASIYPLGDDAERLAHTAQSTHFTEVLDDHFIERPIRDGQLHIATDHALRMVEITEDPFAEITEDIPLYHALADLCRRMVTLAGWEQLERWASGMWGFSFGVLVEMAYTTTRTLPGAAAYGPLRERTTGFYPWFNDQMIGFVAGRHIPAEVLAQPAVRTMRKLSSKIIGYYNDISAFNAEPQPEQAMALPAVLARAHNCSLQDGLEQAAEHWYDLVAELTIATDRAGHSENEHIRFLGLASRHMVAGFVHWGDNLTQRYASTDSNRWTDTQHDEVVYRQ